MREQQAPPGTETSTEPFRMAMSETASPDPSRDVWDGALERPDRNRIGICCSGGGIRSASFSLGALQVLREEDVLHRAHYLSCVSGGGYISIAHALMTSETVKRAREGNGARADPGEDEEALGEEEKIFRRQPPWAPGSPEENHLRNHLRYLAPGATGLLWMVMNLTYGLVRHLLPFLAGLYLVGFATGIAMSRWVGPRLRSPDAIDLKPEVHIGTFAWIVFGMAIVWLLLMTLRKWGQQAPFHDATMVGLQTFSILVLRVMLGVAFLLVLLPLLLVWLSDEHLGDVHVPVVGATGLTAIVSVIAVVARNLRAGRAKLVPILASLSAPILVAVPFIGFTYWNAQAGLDSAMAEDFDYERLWLALASALVLVIYWFLDEVTSVSHLFYRERLATAFVGYRGPDPNRAGWFKHTQPPWEEALNISEICRGTTSRVRMPKLVVCAAVNLSGDLPAGRQGASFTFESDKVGGPATGYVSTRWIEQKAGEGALTLPAMMAISGAAVAPSMGKLTISSIRFLLAVLNLRLGVWLPNPAMFHGRRVASDLLDGRRFGPHGSDEPAGAAKRPGALYVLREALGTADLEQHFVYVTDGGHWENLGLVELLRRGCGFIVCVDGSGGDAVKFGALSEAIALARADLGIHIDIDPGLRRMVPSEDGWSRRGYAIGTICYPDETKGKLVYIRTVIPRSAPQDLRSYAMTDKKFPNHPTSDQLFNDNRFEAYRALGEFNTRRAISQVWGDIPMGP